MSDASSREGQRDLIVGRGTEFAILDRLLALPVKPRGVLVEGEAGIGKTTLWRELVARAGDGGYAILAAAPSFVEAGLSFSGLGDLLEPVLGEALPSLPPPKQHALQHALLMVEAEPSSAFDARAIGLALLDVIRLVAAEAPVLLAIDDVQWLDPASGAALEFALRRLENVPLVLALSQRVEGGRSGLPSLVSAFGRERVEVLEVGPLSLGAVGHLLRERLEEPLSRPSVRRAYEVSGGNPLFAIEVGRSLQRQPPRLPGAPPELPETLLAGLRTRLDTLDEAARAVALAASALAAPSVVTLSRAVDGAFDDGLATLVDDELVVVERGRVRFAHPLYASVIYGAATPQERRALHRRLVDVVDDLEEKARHLVAVAVAPDAGVAATLEEAAALARARGAPQTAALLAEQAASLTPDSEVAGRSRRDILAGRFWFAAGESGRSLMLLERAARSAPDAATRTQALLECMRVRYGRDGAAEVCEAGERALAEARSAGDPLLEALVLATQADTSFDYEQAFQQGRAALARLQEAQIADGRTEVTALRALAMGEFYSGRGLNMPGLERARELERRFPEPQVHWRAESLLGELLERACRFDEARGLLEGTYRAAVDEGDEAAVPDRAAWLFELELALGRWEAAEEWLTVLTDAAERSEQVTWEATAAGMRALLLAHTGEEAAARAAAARSLELVGLEIPCDHALLGLAKLELSLGNLEAAERQLSLIEQLAQGVGVSEPAAWKYEADRIEVLLGLGRLDQARALLARIESRGRALGAGWTRATACRCRGLLLAAEGEVPAALEVLTRALAEHESLPMPFEQARTQLALGQTSRRAKQWNDARRQLERAQTTFAALGARLWAEKAKLELSRVGGRTPVEGGLSPTEMDVAQHVAVGRSNKEVAAELHLSVHTVEANLTRIYAKLGIRSRGELSHLLLTGSDQ